MKLITAIVKPFKLDDVKSALKDAGVTGMTVTEVQGFGRQAGHRGLPGRRVHHRLRSKVRLEILADDGDVERLTDVIAESARTGKIGDGKVWVTTVERALRIRTGEL